METENGLKLTNPGTSEEDVEADELNVFVSFFNDNMAVLDPLIPDVALLKEQMLVVSNTGLLEGFLDGGSY
jgi:hypothetical protein